MGVAGACSERACFYIFFFVHTAGRKTRREHAAEEFSPLVCCLLLPALALLFIYKNCPYASASRPAHIESKEPKKGLATNLNLIVVCSSSIKRWH